MVICFLPLNSGHREGVLTICGCYCPNLDSRTRGRSQRETPLRCRSAAVALVRGRNFLVCASELIYGDPGPLNPIQAALASVAPFQPNPPMLPNLLPLSSPAHGRVPPRSADPVSLPSQPDVSVKPARGRVSNPAQCCLSASCRSGHC